jgi:hypothetical protein
MDFSQYFVPGVITVMGLFMVVLMYATLATRGPGRKR